jgi:hypothetical protein
MDGRMDGRIDSETDRNVDGLTDRLTDSTATRCHGEPDGGLTLRFTA